MRIKCLSVKNPLSYLICFGVKNIENRDWRVETPCELYIHSSGKALDHFYIDDYVSDEYIRQFNKGIVKNETMLDRFSDNIILLHSKLEEVNKFYAGRLVEKYFLSQAIIGKVTVEKILERAYNEIWASSDAKYQWVLKDAVLFSTPIQFVKGQLKTFNFDVPEAYQEGVINARSIKIKQTGETSEEAVVKKRT